MTVQEFLASYKAEVSRPFNFENIPPFSFSFAQWVMELSINTLEKLVKGLEESGIPKTYPDGEMQTGLRIWVMMRAGQLYAEEYGKSQLIKERALIVAAHYPEHLDAFAESIFEQAQRQKVNQIKGVLEI